MSVCLPSAWRVAGSVSGGEGAVSMVRSLVLGPASGERWVTLAFFHSASLDFAREQRSSFLPDSLPDQQGFSVLCLSLRQPPGCLRGCPAFHLPPYATASRQTGGGGGVSTSSPSSPVLFSRLYWQYEVALQLENLAHFSQIVRSFTPAQICTFILKKVIKTFLRKVWTKR